MLVWGTLHKGTLKTPEGAAGRILGDYAGLFAHQAPRICISGAGVGFLLYGLKGKKALVWLSL